jgi:hypothetical protein
MKKNFSLFCGSHEALLLSNNDVSFLDTSIRPCISSLASAYSRDFAGCSRVSDHKRVDNTRVSTQLHAAKNADTLLHLLSANRANVA